MDSDASSDNSIKTGDSTEFLILHDKNNLGSVEQETLSQNEDSENAIKTDESTPSLILHVKNNLGSVEQETLMKNLDSENTIKTNESTPSLMLHERNNLASAEQEPFAKIEDSENTIVQDSVNYENQGNNQEKLYMDASFPSYEITTPVFNGFSNKVTPNLEPKSRKVKIAKSKVEDLIFLGEFVTHPKNPSAESKVRNNKRQLLETSKIQVLETNSEVIWLKGGPPVKNLTKNSKSAEENASSAREILKEKLKKEMQKNKEALFDKHKEIEQVDEEYSDTDSEKSYDYDPHFSSPDQSGSEEEISHSESSLDLMKPKDLEMFKDSQSISCSLPSFQPHGGFSKKEPLQMSNDSNNSDIIFDGCFQTQEKVKPSDMIQTNYVVPKNQFPCFDSSSPSCSQYQNNSELTNSQDIEDVSSLCSGQFSNIDELPWTPASDKQNNLCQFEDPQSFTDSNDNVCSRKRKCSLEGISMINSPPYKKSRDQSSPGSLTSSATVSTGKELQDAVPINNTELKSDEGDEEILAVRSKKCKPIVESEDEEDVSCELFNKSPTCNSYKFKEDKVNDESKEENVSSSESEESSNESKGGNEKIVDLGGNYFFDDEAELSGENVSSDESEDDQEEDNEELPDEVPLSDEELQEQVADIYFKHERDEDARIVKRLKQDFLPEGELHIDGGGRKKKFLWSKNDAEQCDDDQTVKDISSDSEPEEIAESSMLQDKVTWRQKTLKVLSDEECSGIELKENILTGDECSEVEAKKKTVKKLLVNIVGKPKTSQVKVGADKSGGILSAFGKKHGSFLNISESSTSRKEKFLFEDLTPHDKIGNASTSKKN